MKGNVVATALLLMLLPALPAQAQPPEGFRRHERMHEREAFLERDGRQALHEHPPRHWLQGRRARLTPEERRQLRRDIREHGRELYRDPPRRHRGEP